MGDKATLTARDLLELLATRHSADVFVPECKNGPSSCVTHLRLDALALKRSWSRAAVHGYEIKVSRADFLSDNKWPAYLPYCNQLWFVCPSKLIAPSEVGDSAGLLWASANGARLYSKKKAPYRDVVIPEDLWRYILICRAQISDHEITDGQDSAVRWARWLETREYTRALGRRCGRAIREVIAEKIDAVETENDRLKDQVEDLADVRQTLKDLGVSRPSAWKVRDRVEELRRAVPEELDAALRTAIVRLQEMETLLAEIKGGE